MPVGDEAFLTSYIDTEVMKKVQEKIAAIEQIDDLHVRYCLAGCGPTTDETGGRTP